MSEQRSYVKVIESRTTTGIQKKINEEYLAYYLEDVKVVKHEQQIVYLAIMKHKTVE